MLTGKVLLVFLFLHENMLWETIRRACARRFWFIPQHMFLWKNKKNNYLTNPFLWSYASSNICDLAIQHSLTDLWECYVFYNQLFSNVSQLVCLYVKILYLASQKTLGMNLKFVNSSVTFWFLFQKLVLSDNCVVYVSPGVVYVVFRASIIDIICMYI